MPDSNLSELAPSVCLIRDCNKSNKIRRGYCYMHYKRFMKYGSPHIVMRKMHGLRHTPEFNVWAHMKQRCNNERNKAYKNYGGRGVKVCDRWNKSFMAFYKDMGKRPDNKYTLERIDNDGDYTPDNCRWDTRKNQVINRRVNGNNKTGVPGVMPTESGKWRACIGNNYGQIRLGVFKNFKDVVRARKEAEELLWSTT